MCATAADPVAAKKTNKLLSKEEIEKAIPGAKLPQGKRLHLYVSKKGVRSWKWQYRLFDPQKGQDRQFEILLGRWPAMSPKQADAAQAKAWSEFVDRGIHPPQHRKAKAAQQAVAAKEAQHDTLWIAAAAWIEHKRSNWAPAYALQIETYLKKYAGPDTSIGVRPVNVITTGEVSDLIEHIGAATPAVARLVKQWLRRAFMRAKSKGICEVNPVTDVHTADIVSAHPTVSSPALAPAELQALLLAIQTYGGERQTRVLLELLAHLVVRSSELRCATWGEFDLANAVWRIPPTRMKMGREHRIPLTSQVLKLLKEWKNETGGVGLMFPNANDPGRPMAQSSAREAVYRLTGKEFSPHGFRSTFSTMANEREIADPHVIDAVLAHRKGKGASEGSYNQATYFAGRVPLMAAWSAYLESLMTGPLRFVS